MATSGITMDMYIKARKNGWPSLLEEIDREIAECSAEKNKPAGKLKELRQRRKKIENFFKKDIDKEISSCKLKIAETEERLNYLLNLKEELFPASKTDGSEKKG